MQFLAEYCYDLKTLLHSTYTFSPGSFSIQSFSTLNLKIQIKTKGIRTHLQPDKIWWHIFSKFFKHPKQCCVLGYTYAWVFCLFKGSTLWHHVLFLVCLDVFGPCCFHIQYISRSTPELIWKWTETLSFRAADGCLVHTKVRMAAFTLTHLLNSTNRAITVCFNRTW